MYIRLLINHNGTTQTELRKFRRISLLQCLFNSYTHYHILHYDKSFISKIFCEDHNFKQ